MRANIRYTKTLVIVSTRDPKCEPVARRLTAHRDRVAAETTRPVVIVYRTNPAKSDVPAPASV